MAADKHKIWLISSIVIVILIIGFIFLYPNVKKGLAGQAVEVYVPLVSLQEGEMGIDPYSATAQAGDTFIISIKANVGVNKQVGSVKTTLVYNSDQLEYQAAEDLLSSNLQWPGSSFAINTNTPNEIKLSHEKTASSTKFLSGQTDLFKVTFKIKNNLQPNDQIIFNLKNYELKDIPSSQNVINSVESSTITIVSASFCDFMSSSGTLVGNLQNKPLSACVHVALVLKNIKSVDGGIQKSPCLGVFKGVPIIKLSSESFLRYGSIFKTTSLSASKGWKNVCKNYIDGIENTPEFTTGWKTMGSGSNVDYVPLTEPEAKKCIDSGQSSFELYNSGCEEIGCIPSCVGKVCGSDGCGGSCGSCEVGSTCQADGTCKAGCIFSCDGKTCGDDGCGGSCGSCPSDKICSTTGSTIGTCVEKKCTTNTECGAGFECVESKCVPSCVPQCTGKVCGSDSCGGSCGSCAEGQTCTSSGTCKSEATGYACPTCQANSPNSPASFAQLCCESVPGCQWEGSTAAVGQCTGTATSCADYSKLQIKSGPANNARKLACITPCQFTEGQGASMEFVGDECKVSGDQVVPGNINLNTCAPTTGWQSGETYQLTADLVASPGYCFKISKANNLIIDCNGHKITGIGAADSINVGAEISESSGITLKNCQFENFYTGIKLYKSPDNVLLNNNVKNNKYGIYLTQPNTKSNKLEKNTACNNEQDFECYLSSGTSGTGNIFGKILACESWPVQNVDYQACPIICTPNCGSKTCGSDGCGGSCGSCTDGNICQEGVCAVPPESIDGDVTGASGTSDGCVNLDDIAVIAVNVNLDCVPKSSLGNPAGDVTGAGGIPDGCVNLDDIAVIAANVNLDCVPS